MLAIEKVKTLRSGEGASVISLQNEIPVSLCFAWKNGSDCNLQSSCYSSDGYSLTAAERGGRWIVQFLVDCITWKSWKRSLKFSCNLQSAMSALNFWSSFLLPGKSLCISSQVYQIARILLWTGLVCAGKRSCVHTECTKFCISPATVYWGVKVMSLRKAMVQRNCVSLSFPQ